MGSAPRGNRFRPETAARSTHGSGQRVVGQTKPPADPLNTPLPILNPPPQALPTAPTHGKPHKWKPLRSILEQDNNGYTL